jgi:hypothetical protein
MVNNIENMKNFKTFLSVLIFSVSVFSVTYAGHVHTGLLYIPVSTPTVTPTVIPPTIGGSYVLPGCTDPLALNYNKSANVSADICVYSKVAIATTSPAAIVSTETPVVCPFFISYHKKGDIGPEVLKIKTFLNTNEKESLELTNIFDEATRQAVKRFQSKHATKILSPWSLKLATGWWYQSTRKKANDIVGCAEGRLRLDNGVLVE